MLEGMKTVNACYSILRTWVLSSYVCWAIQGKEQGRDQVYITMSERNVAQITMQYIVHHAVPQSDLILFSDNCLFFFLFNLLVPLKRHICIRMQHQAAIP